MFRWLHFSVPFPLQGLGSVLLKCQGQTEATPRLFSALVLFSGAWLLADSEGSVLKTRWEGGNEREQREGNWAVGKGLRPPGRGRPQSGEAGLKRGLEAEPEPPRARGP